MSLRFIYGPAGSGKTYFTLQDIKKKTESDKEGPFILLVPEQFTFGAEKNLIETLGEKVNLKAEVLSFTRLGNRVLNEVGGITHKHMNASGKAMILYRIIEACKEELKVFTKASRQPGFIDIMAEIITELKRYDVTPELLKMVAEQVGEKEGFKEKLFDIHLIFSAFEKTLHEKYIDVEDDLKILASKLEQSKLFSGAEIWIDEFSSFTPQEYKVIEKLLKKAKRVNVTLCTNCLNGNCDIENTDVFAPIKLTENTLLKIAMENNIALDKDIDLNGGLPYRFKDREAIGHIEEHFFSYPIQLYKNRAEGVEIFKAVNTYSEIEHIARNIITLCREEKLRFKDIAVIGRDLSRYENLIGAIFREHGIPYFLDKKIEITNNPVTLLITSALEIINKNWTYETVFRYLKTGLTNISIDSIDKIENYVLCNGIRGKAWGEEQWNYRFYSGFSNSTASPYESLFIQEMNEIKEAITRPLFSLKSKVTGKKTVREICTSLYEFLCDIEVPTRVEERMGAFQQRGELYLSSEYAQIWNIILQLLDQMVEVMGEEQVTLKEFTKIFLIGCGEHKIGLIPPALDQVLVSTVERVKTHDVNVLYIVGVNDGVFPKADNEEGILTDEERELLKLEGIELAKNSKTRAFEEQFLIYRTLTIACKYLKVSYAIADHEGRALRPSTIIFRMKKLFPYLKEGSDVLKQNTEEGNLDLVSTAIPTFNELVGVLRKEVEGIEQSRLWKDVHGWYEENEHWKEKNAQIKEALSYTNQVKKVNPIKIKKLYGNQKNFSVSKFEKYVACPFSYYVQYGLKARERKVYKLTYPDLGIFMHDVLEEFSKVLKKETLTWREVEKPWCVEAVSLIVEEKMKEDRTFILNSSCRNRYVAERVKKILIRAIWLIVEHIKRSGFEPVEYEVEFGDHGEIAPVAVELPSGEKIHLMGRIDRVDKMDREGESYYRVVDYKSGDKAFHLSDVYYGLEIQLLTYLDAILTHGEEAENKPVIPAGMLYFHLDNPVIKGSPTMSEEDIEKECMKKLKMKGLLLAQPEIITEMDSEIEGNSLIIPARINKDGSLGKSSVATKAQFEALRKHVKNKVIELCEEMLSGNIEIKPYKKKDKIPCTYCSYASLCQFDITMSENEYKIIKDKSEEEVWKLIMEAPVEGSEKNE